MVVISSLPRELMGLVGTVAVFFRMCLWAMREIGICRDDGTQYLPPGGNVINLSAKVPSTTVIARSEATCGSQ